MADLQETFPWLRGDTMCREHIDVHSSIHLHAVVGGHWRYNGATEDSGNVAAPFLSAQDDSKNGAIATTNKGIC